ncbi:MAG: branched-chain amino acid transporter permease [Pontibacterium sp.]
MESVPYLIAAIAVMAGATFLTRILPFLVLYRVSEHPLLNFLGRYLPPVIMGLLLIYSFKNEQIVSLSFLPELFSLLTVIALHLLMRNSLLSILGGTGCYMLLVQTALFM